MMYDAQVQAKFQDLEHFTAGDLDAAMERNDPAELQMVSVTLAIACEDRVIAQAICTLLAGHADNKVRGNAIMSLGHLARRFRQLDEERIKPLIESALRDADGYVRIHAKSAADEIHQFLGWAIAGHQYGI